jgi:signal transduction histidine kinase
LDTPAGPQLRLSVADTGVGLAEAGTAAATAGTGFGTGQVRERLATLFGTRATFTLAAADGGGTVACVTLPWPAATSPAPSPTT